MKKIGLIIFVAAAAGIAYWFYTKNNTLPSPATKESKEPNQVFNQLESPSLTNEESGSNSQLPALTTMLASGIVTKQGILQSHVVRQNTVSQYNLTLNSKSLNITAVSPIELVKVFALDQKQIALIAYDQGGNQCAQQYQTITIDDKSHVVSKKFGSCLPLTDAVAESHDIILSMPLNNPYLGPDVLVKYRYHNGNVVLFQKPSQKELKQHYAKLTADQILQIAANDGCYVNGVMLDDNSCGNGHKYCVMFKSMANKNKDTSSDYKILKDFCNQ